MGARQMHEVADTNTAAVAVTRTVYWWKAVSENHEITVIADCVSDVGLMFYKNFKMVPDKIEKLLEVERP